MRTTNGLSRTYSSSLRRQEPSQSRKERFESLEETYLKCYGRGSSNDPGVTERENAMIHEDSCHGANVDRRFRLHLNSLSQNLRLDRLRE